MLNVSRKVRISLKQKSRGSKPPADKLQIAKDRKYYNGKVMRSTDELEMLQA